MSSRAPVGYVAVAANPVATNQGFKNLVPAEGVLSDYVYYFIKGNRFLIETYASGTTFMEVSAKQFAKIPIPICSTVLQRRIVAKIEELFSQLDAGVEELKKAKAQLKRYRQSVLKAAFEGRLTEEWRKQRADGHELAVVREAGRPDGWRSARIDEVADVNPKPLAGELSDETEVTFLPMKAVEERTGRFDASRTRPYSEVRKGYTYFRDGDVLFAKVTPCMENGKVAVVGELKNGVGFGSTEFHVLRPTGHAEAKYLLHFMLQDSYRKDAQRNMSGAVGLLRVPTSFVAGSQVPLAPAPEQRAIVEDIERRFSVLDAEEKAIEAALRQAARLRQSILKRAFEGRLVPQDPTDEPATELLKRIKEHRLARGDERLVRKRLGRC